MHTTFILVNVFVSSSDCLFHDMTESTKVLMFAYVASILTMLTVVILVFELGPEGES
jgi:hypothetical protein